MKASTFGSFAFLLLSAVLASVHQATFAQTRESESEPANLNTVILNLTSAHLDPLEGNQVVRAFVPTGSRSTHCLASLNEIRTNVWPVGITLFCAEREPFAFGNAPGMLVSVIFTQPAPPDLAVGVTLYQQDAKAYAAPVLCTAKEGC